ncbi:MAG: hypothetical protein JXQ75_16860, partial [Phycisphaerae bacterium]|nr:hypothetical protein [Phycisphaerae bacterium]
MLLSLRAPADVIISSTGLAIQGKLPAYILGITFEEVVTILRLQQQRIRAFLTCRTIAGSSIAGCHWRLARQCDPPESFRLTRQCSANQHPAP